jgi:hypothetical protein
MQYFEPLLTLIEENQESYNLAWTRVCDYQGSCSQELEALQNMVEARFLALTASRQAEYKTYLSLPK